MNFPHLIDNRDNNSLEEVLNEFYAPYIVEFYLASGYFYLSGFQLISEKLKENKNLKEGIIKIIISPKTDKITKAVLTRANENEREKEKILRLIIQDLEKDSYFLDKDSVELIIQLIKERIIQIRLFLKDFFHAKAYIARTKYHEREDFYTIVGSSNFSMGGLRENRELNLPVRGDLYFDAYKKWFLQLWENETEDFNPQLLEIYQSGLKNVQNAILQDVFLSPFEMLLFLIRSFLGNLSEDELGSTDQLVEFQRIGAENVLSKLERFGGAIVSDSVGLGKTFTAAEVIKRSIHNGKKVIVITPPTIVLEQWKETLEKFFKLKEGSSLHFLSQGKFAIMDAEDIRKELQGKYDLIVIDEAHRARNDETNLYQNINRLHPKGNRARVLLLTATPFNNKTEDLENLIKLCTTETTLLNAGFTPKAFGELEEFARRLKAGTPVEEIENDKKYHEYRKNVKEILNAIMLLRMRTTIRKRYGKITIAGKPLEFEDPHVERISYTYPGKYRKVFEKLSGFLAGLELAHIQIAKPGKSGKSLSNLYKLLLFKRIESSLYSFTRSIERIKSKQLEWKEQIQRDEISLFNERKTENQEEEDSLFENYEDDVDIEPDLLETEDGVSYSKEEVLGWIENDIKLIDEFLGKYILPLCKDKENPLTIKDPKLEKFLGVLKSPGYKKALIFTSFKDTVEYLRFQLENVQGISLSFETATGDDKKTNTLEDKLDRFAPKARGISTDSLENEIQILIATDVLSEGVNLQDADTVMNFDLPWNPMRIVQRVGRVNRIGSENKIRVLNLSPDDTLDDFLNLIKIIESKGYMVASLLGREMAILSSEKEELHAEDIGEELKSRNKTKNLSEYEEDATSNSFFSDIEGETDEDYFKSYLFSAGQENRIRKSDFQLIEENSEKFTYYTILNPKPTKAYLFYEIYGERENYRDLLSRECYQVELNHEVKAMFPFNLFSRKIVSGEGYTIINVQDKDNFSNLDETVNSFFQREVDKRRKENKILKLQKRITTSKDKKSLFQKNLDPVLEHLLEKDESLFDSFSELAKKIDKKALEKLTEMRKILQLYTLDIKKLKRDFDKQKISLEKRIGKGAYEFIIKRLIEFYEEDILTDPNLRGVLYKDKEISGKILCKVFI